MTRHEPEESERAELISELAGRLQNGCAQWDVYLHTLLWKSIELFASFIDLLGLVCNSIQFTKYQRIKWIDGLRTIIATDIEYTVKTPVKIWRDLSHSLLLFICIEQCIDRCMQSVCVRTRLRFCKVSFFLLLQPLHFLCKSKTELHNI